MTVGPFELDHCPECEGTGLCHDHRPIECDTCCGQGHCEYCAGTGENYLLFREGRSSVQGDSDGA